MGAVKRMEVRWLLSIPLLMLAASQASAGWVITGESSWKEGQELKTAETTMYLQKGLGFKTSTSDGNMVIQRVDTRTTYVVDPERREYSATSWDEMRETVAGAADQMKMALEEMEKELKDAPPGVREMIEQQMKQLQEMARGPEEGLLQVERTGEAREILGYRAEQYLVLEAGERTGEIWASKSPKLQELIADWDQVAQPVLQQLADVLPGTASPGYVEAMRRIEGFPLVTIMLSEGAPEVTTQILSIQKKLLKDEDFLPPAGYTQK